MNVNEIYTDEDGRHSAKTNKGTEHAENEKRWQRKDNGGLLTDYSDVRSGWLLTSLCNGLNGSQTANQAKDFFGKYPIENGGTIPITEDGLFSIYLRLPINILTKTNQLQLFEEHGYRNIHNVNIPICLLVVDDSVDIYLLQH